MPAQEDEGSSVIYEPFAWTKTDGQAFCSARSIRPIGEAGFRILRLAKLAKVMTVIGIIDSTFGSIGSPQMVLAAAICWTFFGIFIIVHMLTCVGWRIGRLEYEVAR